MDPKTSLTFSRSSRKSRSESKMQVSNSRASTPLIDIENSEFLDTEEAALYLRTTAGSIRNATSSGKIPVCCYRKFGRRTLYIKSELRKLLLGHAEEGFFNGR